MTNGIQLQAQSPGAAGADLGFVLHGLVSDKPMVMRAAEHSGLIEAIAANRFVLPRNRQTGARHTEKGTAILELHGTLIDRSPFMGGFWGMTAYEGIQEQVRRIKTNADIKRVVLDINSPGGMVLGIEACGNALADLADSKPLYAIANNMACSGGYWLGCIADEFSITPNGEVGSIGVIASRISYAEALEREGISARVFSAGAAKPDGRYMTLISDGEAAERQYEIERTYDQFVAHVAKFRGISEDAVRATDARCFAGQDAVKTKLVDRVETLEEMVERIEMSAARVKPKRKSQPQAGSKGGLAPANRNPVPQAPDDEAPSAGKTGAKRMSHQVAADGQTDSAAAIQAAIAGYVAGQRAAQTPQVGAQSAPAAAAAAEPAKADAAAEATSRIFAILDSEEAKDKPAMARKLAGNAKLTVDEAKELLKAAAPEKTEAVGDQAALAAGLTAQMAKPGNAAAIKPAASSDASQVPSLASRIEKKFSKKG